MKKKNYTGPVTEFVALKPIYNLWDNTIGMGTNTDKFGDGTGDEEQYVGESAGSWSDIWAEE